MSRGADWRIRYSMYAVVIGGAVAIGIISYQHALEVVRSVNITGATAYLYPATIDGLIYASSMVLLDAARRGVRPHWLAWSLMIAGIVATTAANVAAGLPYGLRGIVVYGWPAPVLVGIYELLMVLIRQGAKTVPTDPKLAAREHMLASIAGGNPLSARALARRVDGLDRDDAGVIVRELVAASNGGPHV